MGSSRFSVKDGVGIMKDFVWVKKLSNCNITEFVTEANMCASQRPRRELGKEYVTGKQVGVGRYGLVRICRQKNLQTPKRADGWNLACKSIYLRPDRDTENDHEKEVDVLQCLQDHPNVVRFHDAILELDEGRSTPKRGLFRSRWSSSKTRKDQLHIIMQLCRGPNLKQLVTDRGRLTEPEAARVIHTVLDVLQHCHSKGIVHRDVKDTNFLFLTPDPSSPLMAIDFGLATHKDRAEHASDLAGSPYFIAPEILQNCMASMKRRTSLSSCDSPSLTMSEDSGKKDISSDVSSVRSDESRDGSALDPRSDVWSAGVLLYFLLSGHYPFDGINLGSIFRAINTAPLDLSSPPWDDISSEAKDLVASLLCRDVSIRPSASDALGKQSSLEKQNLHFWYVASWQS